MLTNTFSVLAQDESEFYIQQKKALIKEVIISKSALSKFSSGEKYIKQIDTFVAKNSNNLNYLIKVRNKLTDIEYQLEQKGSLSEKEKNTLKVIQYF
ncbi:MAG: hypothetical protein H6767_06040 [Candidatus Peribacteria bacterium]|nr:MAG: hypothetical protein H6767_06040 [Candidatus Peribacteria bacterium]